MGDANFDPVERAAKISFQIREVLRQALPAPLEQFFTVMVPGKVVNFADYSEGFDSDGKMTGPILAPSTELNQAILCDDMPTLSPVQLGPTGKSVARSYDAAISKLVPAGTTVGVDVADPGNLSEEEARYEKAMNWLVFRDPKRDNKTRVEIYTEKQHAYTKVVEAKDKAYNDALKAPADYYAWVSEHARTYRNYMQASYMDWVVTGMKEEVEYWFSIVDRDSAMARVEASKEVMRAATVQDTDGSVEYQKVKLSPSNWAVLAKDKAESGKSQVKTVEWYDWEISRLEKMNGLLTALKNKPAPTAGVVPNTDQTDLDTAMEDFVAKRDAYQTTLSNKDANEEEKKSAYNNWQQARKDLKDAEDKLNKNGVARANALNKAAQDKMYEALSSNTGLAATIIEENNAKIANYTAARAALLGNSGSKDQGLVQEIADDAGIPKQLPDPAIAGKAKDVDYFTAITVEISDSISEDTSSTRATSASFGASVGWGLWNASSNTSYSSGSSDASSQMMKNACRISFECMRVDIARSWLRSELFYDADLTTGPNEYISPGFTKLRDLMEKGVPGNPEATERELQRYGTFPLYPTSFLLAANVELEITGETAAIQTHFQQSAVSTSSSFNYGPFVAVSGSYSNENSSSFATCKATANGCRITIKSPQIIGWISQMVPALPRLKDEPTP